MIFIEFVPSELLFFCGMKIFLKLSQKKWKFKRGSESTALCDIIILQ